MYVEQGIDYPFLITVLILVVFGLVMLYSASYASAYYRFGSSFHFIGSQLLFAVVGVLVMLGVSMIDYHIYRKYVWVLYAAVMVLLVAVLFMPEINETNRWIVLPGLGTFQPSEILKFAIIVMFAHIVTNNQDKMKTFMYGVVPFMVVLVPPIILLLLEPHLSATVLVIGIAALMMFVGGTGLQWFALAGTVVVGGVASAVVFLKDLVPYAMERINAWLDPFAGNSYQTMQSLLAIGSGGLAGLGIGNSRQKHLYVPEPQNDFIFAIICEELGFIGAAIVVALFTYLLVRGLKIALNARDKFGAMLAIGITVQVTLQAVLNIAVVTNTIPNTGISLPFFSYGGTSLLMLLFEMGILLSISRQARIEKL